MRAVAVFHPAFGIVNDDVEVTEKILRVVNCVNFLGKPDPQRPATQIESINIWFRPDLNDWVHI